MFHVKQKKERAQNHTYKGQSQPRNRRLWKKAIKRNIMIRRVQVLGLFLNLFSNLKIPLGTSLVAQW